MASDGYPQAYEKGLEIRGLEAFADRDDVVVFHAGTLPSATIASLRMAAECSA